MTRLRRGESLQADGIRDMMENHSSNGSSSSMAMNSTKIWERQPVRNGAAHTTSNGTTTTHKFSDHYGVIKFRMGNVSNTVSNTKGSTTTQYIAWATSGGAQAASGGNVVSNIGTAYDGTSTITNSAIPFSYLAPNADGNKWLEYCGYQSVSNFGISFTAKLAFSGGGAQTTDTDWSKIHVALDAENDYTSNNAYSAFMSAVSVSTLNRTDAVVTTSSSRVVYQWVNNSLGLQYNTSNSADFVVWIAFE